MNIKCAEKSINRTTVNNNKPASVSCCVIKKSWVKRACPQRGMRRWSRLSKNMSTRPWDDLEYGFRTNTSLVLMCARAIRPRHFRRTIQATDLDAEMGGEMTCEIIVFDVHRAVLPKAVTQVPWTTVKTMVVLQVREQLASIILDHVPA
jgi:hypothetical protein